MAQLRHTYIYSHWNPGYDYTIKRAQPGSPYYAQYGELASYRMNCADPAITECQVITALWTYLS